jgi:hypothetical protein
MLTLERWQRIAERLKTEVKDREARAIAARGKADIARFEKGLSAMTAVRIGLSRRNAQLGIIDKLMEAEAVSRRAGVYLSIVRKESGNLPFFEELSAKLALEQARAHALLDEVAAVNRSKLEIELPDEPGLGPLLKEG